MKNLIKTNSLVLKKRNFGEYDRVLLMLTEDYGRIDVLVRGVRKPGARMGGLCESFLMLSIEVEQRRGFDILKEAELVTDYKMLEKSLTGLGVGELLVEVVEMLSNYGQDDKIIFSLLTDYLNCYERNRDMLQQKENIELFLCSFLMSVLAVSGRLPMIEGCFGCGKVDSEKYYLTEYGLSCVECTGQNICYGVIDLETSQLYRQIAMMSGDELLVNFNGGDINLILQYSMQLFDLFHKKELKSFDFLNKVYKNL